MNKNDLIRALAKHTPTRGEARRIVDFIFTQIIDEIVSGGKVMISGLGSFTPRRYKAKTMFDPRSGKRRLVQSRSKVRFTISKLLLRRMNAGGNDRA
jgi:nucleoid DNA-binding protein